VFVNPDLDELAALVRSVPLDIVQLSGDEPPEFCAEVIARCDVPVFKALRLRDEADLDRLDAYALAGATLLLDAFVPGSYGGNGVTGDWRLARLAAERWPVILSGGLAPENAREAIGHVAPRGVDVSSGIETAKSKDPDKMRAFVAAARAANALESSEAR
jgi:phosphoribosylanthranilate isomerase